MLMESITSHLIGRFYQTRSRSDGEDARTPTPPGLTPLPRYLTARSLQAPKFSDKRLSLVLWNVLVTEQATPIGSRRVDRARGHVKGECAAFVASFPNV